VHLLRGTIAAVILVVTATTQQIVSDVGLLPDAPVTGGYVELPHPVPGWEFPVVTVRIVNYGTSYRNLEVQLFNGDPIQGGRRVAFAHVDVPGRIEDDSEPTVYSHTLNWPRSDGSYAIYTVIGFRDDLEDRNPDNNIARTKLVFKRPATGTVESVKKALARLSNKQCIELIDFFYRYDKLGRVVTLLGESEDPSVRTRAVQALTGRAGERPVEDRYVKAAAELLESGSHLDRAAAAQSIAGCDDRQFGTHRERIEAMAQQDPHPLVRKTAAAALLQREPLPELTPEEEAAMQVWADKLQDRVTLHFDEAHLFDVAEFLRQRLDLPITMDNVIAPPGESAGDGHVTNGVVRNINLREIEAAKALNQLLQPLGLAWRLQVDGVYVSSSTRIQGGRRYNWGTYDDRDQDYFVLETFSDFDVNDDIDD
jgi:hypothetical protein